MKHKIRSYRNEEWFKFSKTVQNRDRNRCVKCGREAPEVILQTHHRIYKAGLEPWEYPLSDCMTLCKGCHSREHGLIEPNTGWTLISIDDLGDLTGICEREGCGTEIRYEHVIYHPKWGYKIVGSTCIEYLTKKDQDLSHDVLTIFKKISDFINKSEWENGITQKGINYIYTIHAYHQIRIYGRKNFYSFQIALKRQGSKKFDFKEFNNTKNKSLEQVKELAYIVLKGLITDDEEEKELLRNIYISIK